MFSQICFDKYIVPTSVLEYKIRKIDTYNVDRFNGFDWVSLYTLSLRYLSCVC